MNAMEKRIVRAQEQIDKLNASNLIFVTDGFLKLKLKELHLTHEFREKLRAEREERTEAARLAREEQKLFRDLEEAQREEDRYAALLARAKAEADTIVGPRLDAFGEQLELLNKTSLTHMQSSSEPVHWPSVPLRLYLHHFEHRFLRGERREDRPYP